MSTAPHGFGAPVVHPLVALTAALESALDDAAEAGAWSMASGELQEVLPRLTRARNRLAEAELRVLRAADRHSVGDDAGATDTPAWWAHVTGQRIPAARAAATLAQRLEVGHEAVRAALSEGRVSVDQARVVVAAIEELPASIGAPLLADCEVHLVGLADLDGEMRLDPKALRIAGRKVLEVLAPDVAEAHEARLLEAEERHAAATASFTMRPDGHGSMVGRFRIPLLHGELLAKHLNAIAAPKHQAAARSATRGERVARPLRWGRAFCEYLETRDTSCDGSPKAGGVPATVVVTMTMESLLGSHAAATLDTGERISAAEARRLACEAGIIPAVLGTRSQVLDLGRKTRFHTEPQRVALMLRDRGCAATDCDWPPGMCHAHHLDPWSRGGRTSVDNGMLLCPRHHTLAHDARFQMNGARNGKVTFSRRT
ncbi:MAG TPA: DUF222 domain-containing protein [Marmoricola sp.]|nr:DUF222 domain-containing protein [Marmoricola sp.]